MKKFFKKVRRRLSSWLKILKIKSNSIILFGSPEHGNLGDHAISVAEVDFLKNNFNKSVKEFSRREFYRYKKALLHKIKETNKVFITGGGFLGDLWPDEQKFVEDVISTFPMVKICIFPQTIYFSDVKNIENVSKIFKSHDKLLVCAREKASFELLQNKIGLKNVCLCPDMVIGYKPKIKIEKNENIVFCFRKDKEKVLSEELVNHIEKTFDKNNIKNVSTVVDHSVFMFDRNKELKQLFQNLAEAKLVVTDRLHAMIFSAILNVPCLAYNNVSGKVGGVYDLWLKHCNFVEMFSDADSFDLKLNKIFKNKDDLKLCELTTGFKALVSQLNKFFNKN